MSEIPNDLPARITFLNTHEATVAPLMLRRSEAYWTLATTAAPEAAVALRDAVSAVDAYYSQPELAAQVTAWADAPSGDVVVDRCFTLLRFDFDARRVPKKLLTQIAGLQTDVQQKYAAFRAEVNGETYPGERVEKVLAGSTDSNERRDAWEAAHQIGEHVADDVRELARLRNRVAKQQGYRDWYAMALAQQEISEEALLAILARVDRATRDPFASRKAVLDGRLARRYGVSADKLMPWHYADPFFQRVPEAGTVDLDAWYRDADTVDLATRFFDGIGMNVRDVLARSDLFPREHKNPHAFCTHIDRSGDVRVLCNITPSARWMSTTLHELGHAVYDRYIDRTMHFTLRRPAHTLVTEAIAMLMGRVAYESDFLAQYVEVPSVELGPLAAELRRMQSLSMMIFVRWVLVMTTFERALYADPDRKDLNKLWWDLRREHQLVRAPEGRDKPDWAAKIHIATAPVYYHNYLLGELTASQLRARISVDSRTPQLIDQLRAGEFLIQNVFVHGATQRWDTRIETATGEALNPAHFLREFVQVEHPAG